jgi:hypothetical protein
MGTLVAFFDPFYFAGMLLVVLLLSAVAAVVWVVAFLVAGRLRYSRRQGPSLCSHCPFCITFLNTRLYQVY